jgi:hypothetical protein
MMNINLNFMNIKSDFIEPLNLLQHFVNICIQSISNSDKHQKTAILCEIGSSFIYKL